LSNSYIYLGYHLLKPNKALKQENLQLAVFTAFNILANYKFPLNEALYSPTNSITKVLGIGIFLNVLRVILLAGFMLLVLVFKA